MQSGLEGERRASTTPGQRKSEEEREMETDGMNNKLRSHALCQILALSI